MTRLVVTALVVLIAGCGEAGPSGTGAVGAGGAFEAVEIRGNVSPGGPAANKLLVFAYANLEGQAAVPSGEPVSMSNVAADRSFALTSVPAGDATVLFLVDAKSDGVIDPGDSVAALDDPEHALTGLKAGDEVVLQDISINVAQGKATAAAINVKRAASNEDPSAAHSQ
jgi:hypothetical protein